MGYLVKKLSNKNRSWKVQYQTYKDGRHVKDIRQDDFARLGLHSSMDIAAVREVCHTLNAQSAVRSLQEKRNAINIRLSEDEVALNAFLPASLVRSFEAGLFDKKARFHWRIARKLMLEIKLEPAHWQHNALLWYRLFQSHTYSLSYTHKIIAMLNRWGKHLSYTQQSYYEPLAFPTAQSKQRILDACEEAKRGHTSDPLSPERLESLRSKLLPKNYMWLYLAVWLGLRPSEVDSLREPSGPRTWRLEGEGKDAVLWVYQAKLSAIASKDRWKPIPLLYAEQRACLTIIAGSELKRPLNKTIKKHFGGQTTCYCGRKNFVDMMLARGHTLEAISSWLGHKSLDRTWKSYKNKNIVLRN